MHLDDANSAEENEDNSKRYLFNYHTSSCIKPFFIVKSRVRRKVTRFSPGTRARTRKQRTKKPTTDVNDALEIGSFLPYEDEFSRHVYSDYDSDIGNSQGAIRQADDTICTESVKISAVNQNLPKSDQDVISSKVLSFL